MKPEEKKVLEDFLLDIDCLDQLSKWTNDVNFFEITGMVKKEIKHSNFLAWLFDANANHQLGDNIIRPFIQKVIESNQGGKEINSDIIKMSLLDYYSFTVKREWQNLDIFMVSEEEKVTITIENKIYSSESYKQTEKYRKKIEEQYSTYKNIYIYLTIDSSEAEDKINWCIADYNEILECIDYVLANKRNIAEDVKLLLKNYVSMVRRDILVDNELEKTCNDIYKKHKQALDLIYEHRPDNVSEISDYIKEYLENYAKNNTEYKIFFNRNDCTKSLIRFTTELTNRNMFIVDEKDFGWKNGKMLMYEIEIPSNYKSDCILTISKPDNENCQNLFNIVKDNYTTEKTAFKFTNKKYNKNGSWNRVVRTNNSILTRNQIEEGLEENKDKLNNRLKILLAEEIPAFEKFVMNNMKENK